MKQEPYESILEKLASDLDKSFYDTDQRIKKIKEMNLEELKKWNER